MKFGYLQYQGQQIEVVIKEEDIVSVLYTNHKGETKIRRVYPLPVPPECGNNSHKYYPGKWMIRVWDMDKNAERNYCLDNIIC